VNALWWLIGEIGLVCVCVSQEIKRLVTRASVYARLLLSQFEILQIE